jgi:hypothetical protein
MFQSQANYIAAAVSYAQADGLAGIEPTPAAQAAFTADVDQQSEGTVWTAGGCDSWYLTRAAATRTSGLARRSITGDGRWGSTPPRT